MSFVYYIKLKIRKYTFSLTLFKNVFYVYLGNMYLTTLDFKLVYACS